MKKLMQMGSIAALFLLSACEISEPVINGYYYYTFDDGNGNLLSSAYCDVADADSVKVVFGTAAGDFATYNMSKDSNSPDQPQDEMWAYEAADGDLVPYTSTDGTYMRCEATNDSGTAKETYDFPL